MERFQFKQYENCYFTVSSYYADNKAMAIAIKADDELITFCTVYDILGIYSENIATIKNYSENTNMTEFLQELGVVKEIINRTPCNPHVIDTLNSKNPQTIDTCLINTEILKKYCKEWNYNV